MESFLGSPATLNPAHEDQADVGRSAAPRCASGLFMTAVDGIRPVIERHL